MVEVDSDHSSKRFEVSGGTLFAPLLQRLITVEWPGAEVLIIDGQAAHGVVSVTERVSGRTVLLYLSVPTRAALTEALARPGRSVLTSDASAADVQAALNSLVGGPEHICHSAVRVLAAGPAPSGLTPREQEITRLVAKGLTNREIATVLVVSPHTVRTHLQSVSSRLGVTSRGRLAAKWHQLASG